MMLLLLFGLVALANGWSFKEAAMRRVLGYDPHCTFSRENAISCFSKYVDENHDGKITVPEIYAAEDRYMNWAMKMIRWAVSWGIEVDPKYVLRDCCPNERLEFTPDSFRKCHKTCIPSQEALCLVSIVCKYLDNKDNSFVEVTHPPPRVDGKGKEEKKKGWWFL